MNWISTLNQAIVVIGIPAIAGAVMLLGRKLEVLNRLEKTIEQEIRPDMKDMRERIFTLEGKMSNLLWMYQK